MKNEPLESIPSILDPVTYNNAGKSCYKISKVRTIFVMGYEYLNEIKNLFEKNKLNNSENSIYLLLLKKYAEINDTWIMN